MIVMEVQRLLVRGSEQQCVPERRVTVGARADPACAAAVEGMQTMSMW